MKINRVTINNFIRIGLIDIELPEVVTLIVGENQSGKSSLAEAIKFALTGELVRVTTKGDQKLIIKDGAKSGFASVTVDGVEIKRDIKTGKEADDGNLSVHLPPFLPYLLDAQQFSKQKLDARRSFLINLTGTKISGDDISQRMRVKGVAEGCVEMILPMLRSGFTSAHKEALSRATEARAQWTGLTGCQRYGAVIAASWKPELPEDFDHKLYLEKEKELEQIKASVDQLNIKKGGIVANITNAKSELSEVSKAVLFKQSDLTREKKNIEESESLLRSQEETYRDLNNSFFNAKDKSPVACCECGALLTVEFSSDPAKGRTAEVAPFKPISEDDLQKLQNDIFTVGGNISTLKKELSGLRQVRDNLEDAKKANNSGKNSVSQEYVDTLVADLGDINDKLDDRNADHGNLNDTVTNMRIIAEKITDAEKTISRALDLHHAVENWSLCVETLAPDGIPAEILSDTLKPVNDRLRNTANVTGWPQVVVDPTMEIIVDGRRYSLLSESAQWRADVAIADAIASLSGLGLMIIDRMDVLDIPSRANFMKWINSIKSEYDTVLIFATLKQAPAGLPNGMASHWIINGEIEQSTTT